MDRPEIPESSNEFALGTAIRSEVASYGGIVAFLQTHISERTATPEAGVEDTYRANLRQMERIARTGAAPHGTMFETSGLRNANAFYWGEVIGMEIGERYFPSEEWSQVLYENLSDYYATNHKWAVQEELSPAVAEHVGPSSPSRDASRALLIANLMLGSLEDTEVSVPLPDEILSIVRDFAIELSLNEEEQHYIELGYTLIMRIYSSYAIERVEQIEALEREAQLAEIEHTLEATRPIEDLASDESIKALGEAVGRITEWDILSMNDEA